ALTTLPSTIWNVPLSRPRFSGDRTAYFGSAFHDLERASVTPEIFGRPDRIFWQRPNPAPRLARRGFRRTHFLCALRMCGQQRNARQSLAQHRFLHPFSADGDLRTQTSVPIFSWRRHGQCCEFSCHHRGKRARLLFGAAFARLRQQQSFENRRTATLQDKRAACHHTFDFTAICSRARALRQIHGMRESCRERKYCRKQPRTQSTHFHLRSPTTEAI